ncbi:four-helix bundle copper-binding protein [Rhizobium sp. AQ_MP]|uniref:four-helix bundle copper-binding protein n=1 Tax=Rhizobium sp. AQ_MP TaxID=2761536 RepID=UPI001639F0FC|nr:four-helix bundle copper-binding protein [Rhizobium sp. AQ_MP]MBC2774008.1 four-helix bundle copper-binding protein [Rhizobium sp. AQ_MP]
MSIRAMIETHPRMEGAANDALIACIEACFNCAQTCISCADACLAEDMVAELRQCIRLNEDCADICLATGRAAIRRTGRNTEVLQKLVEACTRACALCADECGRHGEMHEHCRICGEACRVCENACRQALTQIQ